MSSEGSRAPESLRGSGAQRVLQRTLTGLWVAVVPVLLALLSLRFLVPPAGTGLAGAIAWLGHNMTVPLGIALFFLFSGLARYWRFRIPGGRYASTLPADLVPDEHRGERLAAWAADAALYELAISPAIRGRLEPPQRDEVDARLTDLGDALRTGDELRARSAATAIASGAGLALAAVRRREVLTTLGATALAAAAAYGVRAKLAQSYEVLSASMLPTLEPRDRVIGNKVAYAMSKSRLPHRGDVIAFQSAGVALPVGLEVPDILVKRVIGLPGDRVAVNAGQPVINGWPVPFCDAGEYVYLQSEDRGGAIHGRMRVEFIDDRAYLTVNAMSTPFLGVYEVKRGEVFVLGDNRGNSLDSRFWNGGRGGGVPFTAVDARAQWFLIGTHRSGDPDFGRLASGIDALQSRVHLEGVNARSLEEAIARCMANRPTDTCPPPPPEPSGPRASREAP